MLLFFVHSIIRVEKFGGFGLYSVMCLDFFICSSHLVIIWRPGSSACVCLSVFFPWRSTALPLVQARCQSIRFHSACVCFSGLAETNKHYTPTHILPSLSHPKKKNEKCPVLLCQGTEGIMNWFFFFSPLCALLAHILGSWQLKLKHQAISYITVTRYFFLWCHQTSVAHLSLVRTQRDFGVVVWRLSPGHLLLSVWIGTYLDWIAAPLLHLLPSPFVSCGLQLQHMTVFCSQSDPHQSHYHCILDQLAINMFLILT